MLKIRTSEASSKMGEMGEMGEMELDPAGHGGGVMEEIQRTCDSAVDMDSKGVGGKCYSRPDHSTKGLSRTQYRDQKNKTKPTLKQLKTKTNCNFANL